MDKFELISSEYVDERGVNATLFRHKATGAQVLSVDSEDDNKVFSINFRTLPKDNTGVPHILEHSVLCGSRRYPVKEPFVEMLKGSLNTFLNAMTGADRTMYPVASMNKQDFFNLANVYLDACLHPNILDPELGPQILKQEGWHYEAPGDSESPLSFKGVVFNEMKGVYSSADSVNGRLTKKAMFKDHPIYSIDSGGDPTAIPDLTYEQFKGFHTKYYHPGLARFYIYGDQKDISTVERLAMLENYLSEFGPPPEPEEKIPFQPLASEPIEVVETYSVDAALAAEPKQFVTLAWLIHGEEPLDDTTDFALGVVNNLLLGSAASPLRKRLMESGLGASVIGGGFSGGLQQASFSVGLKGVEIGEDAKAKVVDVVMSTLRDLVDQGFEKLAIEASMNTVEFSLRASGASPMKGMSFMYQALSEWNYGRDPIAALRFEAPLADVKEKLASGERLFENLIEQYVLNNPGRVTVQLVPEAGLDDKVQAAEVTKLAVVKESLSTDEIIKLQQETVALKALQMKHDDPADLAKLPTLSISDIDPLVKAVSIQETAVGKATLLTHELPADGLVYLDVLLDLKRIPLDDIPYVPLLTRMLSELGTTEQSEVDFSRRVRTHTGGVGVSVLVSSKPGPDSTLGNPDDVVAYLTLGGRSTREKCGELFGVAKEMLTSTNLDDRDRVLEMLKESKIRKEASVSSSGNAFASQAVTSKFTLSSHLGELMGGLSQLAVVKAAIAQAESDWPTLLARLDRMRAALLNADGAVVNLSADGASLADATALVPGLIDHLSSLSPETPPEPPVAWTLPGQLEQQSAAPSYDGLQVATKVNYVAKGGRIFSPGEFVPGSARVITRYLRTAYLWDEVRVQGGAYGCSLGFDRMTGVAAFSSYRDPNVAKTLNAYDGTAAFLRKNPLSEAELSKAIIGAVSDLDSPTSVSSKGYNSMLRWLLGVSDAQRQLLRDQVLATTPTDFLAFADRLDSLAESGDVAVVGSQDALEQANSALPASEQLVIRQALL